MVCMVTKQVGEHGGRMAAPSRKHPDKHYTVVSVFLPEREKVHVLTSQRAS